MEILIIEDEPGIVRFLTQGLEEEGYGVASAADGVSGLDAAIAQEPDIVLLDWMLPGMSGLEVCTRLRERGIAVPIIFLTARDTVHEAILGLKAGANDYIRKPFSFDELLERIRVQLRATPEKLQDTVVGEIRVSPSSHRVFRAGTEVGLTQREFELLAYLLRYRNQVRTRSQIISEVWDIHFDYDTGVIDVFINAIRKKLGLGKDDFIKTIRGVGYSAEF